MLIAELSLQSCIVLTARCIDYNNFPKEEVAKAGGSSAVGQNFCLPFFYYFDIKKE